MVPKSALYDRSPNTSGAWDAQGKALATADDATHCPCLGKTLLSWKNHRTPRVRSARASRIPESHRLLPPRQSLRGQELRPCTSSLCDLQVSENSRSCLSSGKSQHVCQRAGSLEGKARNVLQITDGNAAIYIDMPQALQVNQASGEVEGGMA